MANTGARTAGNLELVGGDLCLDLANTVNTQIESLRHEYLISYDDLLSWGQHVGILTGRDAKHLRRLAAQRPAAAAAVLDKARSMRETIYHIFSAVANQKEPSPSYIPALNEALAEIVGRLRITPSREGFKWEWVQDPHAMDLMLWPVVRSAADLLTRPDLQRVRQCAGECCDWLFIDTSKNQSRRWCSMNFCGSRDKARRYYHRKKAKTA